MFEESIFEGGVVLLNVGRAKRQIYVHRRLLRARSPYFESILTYREGEITSLSLPDVDAGVFHIFLSWLYRDMFVASEVDEWMTLCKLWLLAERFKVMKLQNQVVETFSCRLRRREVARLDLEIFHFVYDNTGPGSELRQMFVHMAVWYGCQDVFEQMMKEMPPVFEADFTTKQDFKNQGRKNRVSVSTWDLTEFLRPEVSSGPEHDVGRVRVKTEADVEEVPLERYDMPKGDRDAKRKRLSS